MVFRVPSAVSWWWWLSFVVLGVSLRAEAPAAEAPSGSPTPAVRKSYEFSCTIEKPGLTSAGIFDSSGRLVRVLWTMKEVKEAGILEGKWNGNDGDGKFAPPGEYTWKVVVNRSKYDNLGTIGNTGQPPTTSGHVPVFLEGVAVDAKGGIYTVHGWDEPHFSVIKWSPEDGGAEFNTDNAVGEALLRGIAVEPDGSYAYVTGLQDLSDGAKTKFSIWRIKLVPGRKTSKVEDFSKAGRSIAVCERSAEFLENASAKDRELISMPLLSLALHGDVLFATDALRGRVLLYDKRSGELKKEIPVPLACGIAVEPSGQIWVGHEHEKVSVLSPEGDVLATPISDLKDVRALSFLEGKLYVADRGAGQVRIYKVEGNDVWLEKTFGEAGRPGDRVPERFTSIGAMALDPHGNVIIADRAGPGSRMQKFNPGFKQFWQQMGLEFVSQGTFSNDDPDTLFSSTRNAYRLDRKAGGWEFLGSARTDKSNEYFGHFETTHRGPPRIVRFGEKDFFYFLAGDGIAVYHIDPPEDEFRGPTLKLVAALAGAEPLPDGTMPKIAWKPENRFLWSWHDEQGDNQLQKEEITFAATPENPKGWEWPMGGFTVDEKGWIWIASYVRRPPNPRQESTVWAIPPKGPNRLGNPVYDWDSAQLVVTDQAGPDALEIPKGDLQWKLVGRSCSDGMIYGLASARKAGAPQEGGLHMGSNVIMGFRETSPESPGPISTADWAVVLPKVSVGLTPIPGGRGGVLIGGDPWRGGVRHYTKDGLLIGGFHSDKRFGTQPLDWPSGLLDSHLAINCNRDPRDGLLDVWTEDNFNLRLIWYRVDDRDIETFEGKLEVK
jgi:DNA-binding beta-propeller fold protein YncE